MTPGKSSERPEKSKLASDAATDIRNAQTMHFPIGHACTVTTASKVEQSTRPDPETCPLSVPNTNIGSMWNSARTSRKEAFSTSRRDEEVTI